ncbi:MAG: hypothetical protein JNM88_12995 [Chitinophagaceae bacterium]|nr:hypothetical protein [Chitinophagaceae bacterium]
MKGPALLTALLFSTCINAQVLKLHFLYGSKPAKGYKATESKHFGGIKGGHVNIELNGKVLDFLPGNCPIFPENKNPTGGFRLNGSIYWDTASTRWATIVIPISAEKEKQLETLFNELSQKTPYDYAVFGMRCAAATYDVLSEAGLVKKLSNSNNIIRNFYPKLLRKRMMKWAEKNNYTIISHEGKPSRKWESDKGIF